MAWDIWKRKNDGRDYGRGDPPPADSVEWAGIPQSAANMMARGKKPPVVATMGAEGEPEKKKPWPWLIGGFIVGLITGSWGRGDD